MAKPAHTRVTFSGLIGTAAAAVEQWSFNLCFPSTATGAAATLASLQDKADLANGKWSNEMASVMPSDVVLNKVRVAHVGDDGHVTKRADGSYVQADGIASVAGTQAKQPMPLQTALCVSLNTGRAGPTGKGRFFLPWPALSLDMTDKRLPVAQVEGFIDNVQAWLNTTQTAMGEGLVVVSSKGYISEVVSVRIGRAPDTMRSRREDAPEGYITLPLA